LSIEQYIKDSILENRLNEHSVLAVYDESTRYHKICTEMASESCLVVDVTYGSLESRQQATQALSNLIHGEKLLIYIPKSAPVEDDDKQKDPFAMYAAVGSIFPDPERSGDNYLDICLKAKPDQATEIRELFNTNSIPSFDVINAIGGGANWPTLETALHTEGATSLLFKFMTASSTTQAKLTDQASWIDEAVSLFDSVLGFTLRTKQRTWSAIADELWRFVLFSEFVFDLNEDIPPSLEDVPKAKLSAKPVIEDLGDNLRKHVDYQNLYVERAQAVETELKLDSICANITKLGRRDTFPFEERCFLKQAIEALLSDNGNITRNIIDAHSNSVWSSKSDSQVNWEMVKSSQKLLETCSDLKRELPSHTKSQSQLVEFYQTSLRRADQLHREFEHAVSDCPDAEDLMPGLVNLVRKEYRELVEGVQFKFTEYVNDSHWPPENYISSSQIFNLKVAPKLEKKGVRVAYLMVDALRYELGYELNKQLSEDVETNLSVAFTTLPSITPIGMASLLPQASDKLSLHLVDGKIKPLYDGEKVSDVPSRMGVFRKRYGDRFQEMELRKFLKARKKIETSVELLVLRTTEIDSLFENHPETAPSMMQRELKQIRQAVNKLQNQGFQKVFIVTDHGFYMNNAQEAGDIVARPDSSWKVEHQRILVGKGNLNSHHYCLDGQDIGIKTEIEKFAGPRSLSPYRKGMLYYHGGLSIQECLVPIIDITLKNVFQKTNTKPLISLDYKKGKKKITSRFAVIELKLESLQAGLLDKSTEIEGIEVLLEAHNSKNVVVGEARPGENVNAATGTIVIQSGPSIKVTIKMDPEFEGKFKVKAIDPITNTIIGTALELETDYTV
jgi:hypothetical protein